MGAAASAARGLKESGADDVGESQGLPDDPTSNTADQELVDDDQDSQDNAVEMINHKEVEDERALQKIKNVRHEQVFENRQRAELASRLQVMSSELMKEQEQEVTMDAIASTFLSKRKPQKNPFKYDEFKTIERAYKRHLIAKQQDVIRRSQNQAKCDKEEAIEKADFLRIHKAVSDLEGWGPGLRLSCRKGNWFVVGISKNSGASLSGVGLDDKVVSVSGQVVSGMTFDNVRKLLLGPKDTKVFVTVSKKNLLWSSSHQYVLLRSLPSASFDFSAKEVVEKTLAKAVIMEELEAKEQDEENRIREALQAEAFKVEEARIAAETRLIDLKCQYTDAPQLNEVGKSLIYDAVTKNVTTMGLTSFVISIHDRSALEACNNFSAKLADKLAAFLRSYHVEPVVNIICDYNLDKMSKSTWRSSIEQGASTNGIPVCVLIWNLEQWKMWQLWMTRHYNDLVDTNRKIGDYRKKLLNFEDEDFIQEALHVFSAAYCARVSRIHVFVDKTIEPTSLLAKVRTDLMQELFGVDVQQVTFLYEENVCIDLSIFTKLSYADVPSFFDDSKEACVQYYSKLFFMMLTRVSTVTSNIQNCGPDIRNLLCAGKTVITADFVPTKDFIFSGEQIVTSQESLEEQHLLKQPQHVILYQMIETWNNNPMSAKPGKKLFFFTPELSGFSSALDWIHESLRAKPPGLEDIVPILIRIPRRFQGTGLAESQSVINALYTVIEDTLAEPPFNFLGSRDKNRDDSTASPEQLMEGLAKLLAVACKQLQLRFLIFLDNIHYVNFDTDNMGCIQWLFSRMPENVRLILPFLLNSRMHISLKSHIDSIMNKGLAENSNAVLLQGLEYRRIPVFTSHQRYFFERFVASGTACQLVARKLCEDYFAWYLHISPNIESHMWLLISSAYVMVHHLWEISIKPLEMFLPSDLKSLVALIVKDFSSTLSGNVMLTAARIIYAAKYGITAPEITKVMMITKGHRGKIFEEHFEYHQSCKVLFEYPGQAQALQRFCCIFARMEGQGFSTSSILMLHQSIYQHLEESIFKLHGPILEVPSIESLKRVIFDFVYRSCNLELTETNGFNFKDDCGVIGSQLRQFLILTDFAISVNDKTVFVQALTSSRIVHARIVVGCIDWVIGNLLQALRMAEEFDESELNQLYVLFRSLISHKSRAPLLRIQPDLYYSVISTTPSKEYLCQRTMDILGESGAPWLRHINKQLYFQMPINNLADLPTEASAVATSKLGHLVAAGDFLGNVAVWHVSSSDLLCVFKSHSEAITGVVFTALDYIIISCSVDYSININSVYSSSVLSTITPHNQPVSCIDIWLKDSHTFATVSRDGMAAITSLNLRAIAARSSAWTAIKDGRAQNEFTEEELGSLLLKPSSVTFVFRVSSFEVQAENVHTNFVNCIACHPESTDLFATGSRDSSIIVWKVDFSNSTSKCLYRYFGHNHWILSLDWMQTGHAIVSSSMSAAIHVWIVPYDENQDIHAEGTTIRSELKVDEQTPDFHQEVQVRNTGLSQSEYRVHSMYDNNEEFSEFDVMRVFMEREEEEITKVSSINSESNSFEANGVASARLLTIESEPASEKIYKSCYTASIALDLTDERFPWKTKNRTKQYASNVRFLGSESMWLFSIENESLTYDAKNNILTSLFRGHVDKINSVAFSPLLDIFFTASSDAFVKAWDISRAPELVLLEHGSLASITTIVLGQQSSNLFHDSMECTFFYGCSDGSLGSIECQKKGLTESMKSTEFSLSSATVKHDFAVSSMSYFKCFKSSLPEIVASGDENGGIMLWNVMERKRFRTLDTKRSSSVVSTHFFLPAVSAGEDLILHLFSITGDAFCVVWNAESGSALRFIHLMIPTVSHIHICREQSLSILQHPGSSMVTLISHETLADLGRMNLATMGFETRVKSVTLSNHGERCAIGSTAGDIYLIGSHSRQVIAVAQHHKKEVKLLLWTHFMNRLISVSADMTIAFWDGSQSYFDKITDDNKHAVCIPIIHHKLDANITVIKECDNIPWFMVTLDDRCASSIWNIATAGIVCKIAIHNSSPAVAFSGRAVCYGNSQENTPIVFSLEDSDILGMVRGESSLLTDKKDRDTVRKEQAALRKWKSKFWSNR